mgnify:CR=1 FL=1
MFAQSHIHSDHPFFFHSKRHSMGQLSILSSSDQTDMPHQVPQPTMEGSSSLDALAIARLNKPQRHRLLHVTRQLSKLTIQSDAYRVLFGSDVLSDFAHQWKALSLHNLVEIGDAGIRLTERGMFFSDTVTSVVSHRYRLARVERSARTRRFLEGNQSGFMQTRVVHRF